ncbi:LamG-like jellyroll fold domain-containing protein, partial [Nocardioides sp. YIM 152588]|uniref:LamG-like jellyroll fold domain-containing protein n=1 Tax=Nocardioides sp. YIM 152588 TaxID=3158259 RepID=UPI0032E480C9
FGDAGLSADTVYRYRVRAVDAAGNVGDYSNVASATTPAAPDVAAPTAPAALSAVATPSGPIDLTWDPSTDDVGVAGYRVERCTGSGCTDYAEIGQPSTTAYTDSATQPSTVYRYRVRAEDAAGNLSPYTNVVAATTAGLPDTTPPTAPSGLTVTVGSSTLLNVAWTASTDDVGVDSYVVERCQGTACATFDPVATPTATSYADGDVVPDASYSYRVMAVDAAGNASDYSAVASASTPPAPTGPPGLVAGWSFDEASGSTVADLSGNGNDGAVLGGTSWVSGKYGGALSFDGASGRVSVPASASLDLSSAMTLMAWIEPTASQSGWRTIMQRETDAYFLNASNSTGALRPSGGGTIGGGAAFVTGTTASPVGQWTHVALTYDGAELRLYVNGQLAASSPKGGAVQSTSNPLSIGGNSPYGEYFQGLIDEARVYDRALSAADVQAAMATPLS